MSNPRKWPIWSLAVAAFLLVLAGCGSNSEITRSYVDPTASSRTGLSGVLIVGVAGKQESRIEFEDAFAKSLARYNVKTVPSHTLVENMDPKGDELIAAAKKAGLDMILITRYIGERAEEIYHPGTVYYGVMPAYGGAYNRGRYGGYYGHAYEVAYEQPVWSTNRTYTIISDLFLTNTEEHMWQAVSDTIKAGGEKKLLNDIIKSFVDDLKKQNLLD
ncbi:hypothetical protein EYC98_18695 [Halieaceae bacterium IMCC14734]|uniref:DUF4136 domain-containing protein n=1 Tax=Candidatus Litorirhabdus singularis TaxID=2518993 RepID=A0ABT3TMC4_9GAMM|nr:hypothetical protein [Candidatus Litorirhabdus singularis]MCX2982895.1 hypothetical protein [Candidatus Litorirhabdus singularis]